MAKDDCNCCGCDPGANRLFEQSIARYNDRSAFANNLQQDSVIQMQNMFQAQAQNELERTPESKQADMAQWATVLTQLIAAAKT